jgi:phosphoserine phosphatase RsbU/P
LIIHSGQAADPEWRQLLRLGEGIVSQGTPEAQCGLISKLVGEMLNAQVRVWLSSPGYPLPGHPQLETLPETPATPLAHRALSEECMQCDPPIPQPVCDENGPFSVAIPLKVYDSLLGVIQLDRPDGGAFTERDLSLLEGLAAHAAAAMEVTRQESLKNWRYQQLSLVRSVSGQIASLTDLNQLCNQVTRLIQKTFNYYYVAIFTREDRSGVLRFKGSASQEQIAPLQPGFAVRLGEGIIGSVGESGEEIIAPDVREETRYLHLDLLPRTRAEAALPLRVENRILGVLDIQSSEPNSFHENDMIVLHTLADNIALAVESTLLYADLQRRADQIRTVFEVSHALTSILDLDELLDEVVRLIQNRFGYPFVHVYTVHPGRQMVVYQTGTGDRSEAMKAQGRNYPLDAPQGLIPWVARNKKTFVSNDVSREPLYLPSDLPPLETRAELTVPLIAGDEVLGVLDIQSQEINAFDENACSLFEALAAPIAIAMRNASFYRTEQWRRRVAESFRDVAHLISANLPLNQLLDIILEKLESNLPCEASAVWLLEEDRYMTGSRSGPRLRLAATRNIEPEKIFEALQDEAALNMLERAIDAEEPLIRRVEDPRGPLGAAKGFGPSYSSIAAPMRTRQRVLGMLTLAHSLDGRYGSEAQAITATFASYAAVAIQNARLYSEAQEQALISTMLLQVAEASQTIMTLEDLLATMVRLTRLLVGVKKCAFFLWDDNLQVFELKAWYGFEPGDQPEWMLSSRLPAFTRLLSEKTTLYLDDPTIEMNAPQLSLTPEEGTYVMLPLLVRGEMIGAFLVCLQVAAMPGIEDGFDPKALAILQGIAHQTAMTADNLRLLESRQEEAYVTAALLQVAQAVVTSNDLNDTLDTIVHLLPILIGIETCIIYLWDAASQLYRPTQVSAESRREEEQILAQPFAPGEHILLDTVRSSSEMHLCQISHPDLKIDEWSGLPCFSYDALIEEGFSMRGDWVLGYPLILQGQTLGALVIRESKTSPAFWERRMEIIQGIAQQISIAIQNDLFKQEMVETERWEREIQLARQIQETFLPDTLPNIKHWELDMRWETAREVGGDFYDIFKLEDNRLGLVIADVSDKGLPAALYMTVARTLIRTNAAGGEPPAQVLKEVNQMLVNDSNEAMFITAVYAILSLETGELVYANAGHNRPLLYRYGKQNLEQLPKGGTALGVLDDVELANHHLKMLPGDSLFFFTDGVTDIVSPEGDFFGDPRLHEVIHKNGRGSIHNLLEALDDALIEFRQGTPPTDDITIVAARREPPRQRGARRAKTNADLKKPEEAIQEGSVGEE